MKKRIINILVILLFFGTIQAQNITKIEYYIDTDPGYGLGTEVPITAGTPINNLDITVPMAIISDGFHQFFARAKDVNCEWSMVSSHQFLKVTPSNPPGTAVPNIVKVEYYLDIDPGFGVATDVPITAGTTVNNLNINLPMTGILDGFHQFFARAKDSNGVWSMVSNHQFLKTTVVIPPTPTIPTILKAEYFIDTDPGYGLGTDISIQQSNNVQNVETIINISALAAGAHNVYLRTKDANNHWSIVNVQSFTIEANSVLITANPTGYCKANPFKIKFQANGTFFAGNVFTAQLSNSAGSFASPTNIGTLIGTASSTILAIIPNAVTVGTGYKIRVIASNPALAATVDEENFEVMAVCANQIFTGNVAPTASGNYCTGSTITIPYTTFGTFAGGNIFKAQLSDVNGNNFVDVPSIVGSNTVLATILDGLPDGDFYRFRIVSTDPQITGTIATQYLRIRNSDLETILSSQSGNWNDPNVWSCSRIPISQRNVVINAGQIITAPTGSTSAVATLTLNGSLNFGANPAPNTALVLAKLAKVLTSGTLNIANNLEITSTGVITTKIYSSTDYDKIVVGGLAELNGVLNIVFDADYVPTAGNSFTVLSYAGIESGFTTINLPSLPNNMTWETNYGTNGLIFTIKPATALPVNLITFAGKAQEKTIQLGWRTTAETNFSHFEIQKSEANKEFGTIGKVTGNNQSNYNFTDTNPTEGNNYYRLKMVDLDGSSAFSKTISVNYEKNGYYLSIENPAKNGEFMIKANYPKPSFSMVNSIGKKLEISVTEFDKNTFKIKAKNTTNGIYFLSLESEGKLLVSKVLME
jgi:hypothetical protein